MQGPSMQDSVEQGIIPRSIHGIFDRIYKTDEHIEFTVQVCARFLIGRAPASIIPPPPAPACTSRPSLCPRAHVTD
jgi:hypothetical protein